MQELPLSAGPAVDRDCTLREQLLERCAAGGVAELAEEAVEALALECWCNDDFLGFGHATLAAVRPIEPVRD
jgi:hypothetical protein